MGLECINSIQGTHILESGVMGKAMVLECRLVLMEAATLEGSSVGSNMVLDATISGDDLISVNSCFSWIPSVVDFDLKYVMFEFGLMGHH